MRLSARSFFLSLLLCSGAAQALRALSGAKHRQEFIDAMRQVEEENNLAASQESLQERLLQAAQKVTPEALKKDRELYDNYYNNYNQNGNNYNQNGNNNYNNNQNNYQNNNNGNDNQQQEDYQAYQDYKQYDGGYSSGVDLTEYSLKYIGCQNIHTWSDEEVESGNEPIAMKRYVILRLCESDTCSAYNKWGCNYDYGEYALPMEDYLEIMSNYHFQQYNRYCSTCEACETFDYTPYQQQQYNNQYNNYQDDNYQNNDDQAGYNADGYYDQAGDDAAYYQYTYGDDGNTDDAGNADDGYTDDAYAYGGNRNLYDNYNNGNDDGYYGNQNYNGNGGGNNYNYNQNYNGNGGGNNYNQNNNGNGGGNNNGNGGGNNYNNNQNSYAQLPWYIDRYGKCMFDNVCSNYKTLCQSYDPNAAMYQEYFTCTVFQLGNQVGYLGPHCRKDGRTIGIGIYGDENCNTYISDVDELKQYTAKQFDDSELSPFYDTACISCKASESYALRKDGNDAYDEEDYTYPLCGAVYDNSAKCNQHIDSSSSMYANEEDQIDSVCPFIESLVENNYDETGEVVIYNDFHLENWKSGQEYVNLVRKASKVQLIGIVVSVCTALGLFIYATYLYKKLLYRRPWKPPRHVTDPISGSLNGAFDARAEAGRISRNNSGIMAARTSSYDGQSTTVYSASGGSGIGASRSFRGGEVAHGDLSYSAGRTGGVPGHPSEGTFA